MTDPPNDDRRKWWEGILNARKWAETETGRLFIQFESLLGRAWVVDQTSNSDRRMKESWERSNKARGEFLEHLKALEQDAARYRWLVRKEYVAENLWSDFPTEADTGTDPAQVIDARIRLEQLAAESEVDIFVKKAEDNA